MLNIKLNLVVLATAKCFKIKGGKHWHSSVGAIEVCVLNSVSTTVVSLSACEKKMERQRETPRDRRTDRQTRERERETDRQTERER